MPLGRIGNGPLHDHPRFTFGVNPARERLPLSLPRPVRSIHSMRGGDCFVLLERRAGPPLASFPLAADCPRVAKHQLPASPHRTEPTQDATRATPIPDWEAAHRIRPSAGSVQSTASRFTIRGVEPDLGYRHPACMGSRNRGATSGPLHLPCSACQALPDDRSTPEDKGRRGPEIEGKGRQRPDQSCQRTTFA